MKGGRRTTKGRVINMDDLIASAPHTTSVGNMGVNAQGDKMAVGGEISQTREKRSRSYYKNHPQSSNQKVSLKGEMQEAFKQGYNDLSKSMSATSKTQYENKRTSVEDSPQSNFSTDKTFLDTEPELSEFNDIELPESSDVLQQEQSEDYDTEPSGYKEVELDNGDIVMEPYWLDQDHEDDL